MLITVNGVVEATTIRWWILKGRKWPGWDTWGNEVEATTIRWWILKDVQTYVKSVETGELKQRRSDGGY